MRIFDPDVVVKTLPELGFPADAQRWEQLTQRTHGIILVTGPPARARPPRCTPPSRRWPHRGQCVHGGRPDRDGGTGLQPDAGAATGIDLSFADGVRALMRQDPDIIMVGEIRDLATAEMAIQAALTGHLVLSTLHTNDAPSAVMRLLNWACPTTCWKPRWRHAQRLVRCLCPDCKQPDGAPATKWQDVAGGWNCPAGPPSTPVGCPECRQTGYRGRTGLYELLTVTEAFSRRVRAGADIQALRRQSLADGMKPLRIAGALKIRRDHRRRSAESSRPPHGHKFRCECFAFCTAVYNTASFGGR
jgi:general secretion pathway protein E